MLVAHGNVMRARGFTLIEALVVLSIAAIVLAIGAPNLSFLIASMNARSASFDLIADLALARSEAIKRNAPVYRRAAGGGKLVAGLARHGRRRDAAPARSPAACAVGRSAAGNGLQFRAQRPHRRGHGDGNVTWAITSSNATPRCVVITPTGAARSKAESLLMRRLTSLRRARGFTLIEILVTLVITAVGMLGLAGFVVRATTLGADSIQRARARDAR